MVHQNHLPQGKEDDQMMIRNPLCKAYLPFRIVFSKFNVKREVGKLTKILSFVM